MVGDVVTHVKGTNILPPAASGWSGNRSIMRGGSRPSHGERNPGG